MSFLTLVPSIPAPSLAIICRLDKGSQTPQPLSQDLNGVEHILYSTGALYTLGLDSSEAPLAHRTLRVSSYTDDESSSLVEKQNDTGSK